MQLDEEHLRQASKFCEFKKEPYSQGSHTLFTNSLMILIE